MLILGLYLLYVLGAYKIFTEFVPWKIFQYYHLFCFTLYIDIDLCILLTSLLVGVIFLNYDSLRVYTIIGDS